MATLRFLGAAGSVTGSKFLLETPLARIMVDCGLFQGPRELKLQNWGPLPIKPHDLDAVVLTHAHLDHTGYLPRLIKGGYDRKAFCTPGTADLLSLMLPDAGFLQEEEAHHANRKGWSRHQPALPLFTMLEAQRALRQLRPLAFGLHREIAPGITLRFHPAGHILGAAIAELVVEEPQGKTSFVFSGDLGREVAPLLRPPVRIPQADYLLVESTYGDRRHGTVAVGDELARVVNEACARRGMVLIPAFAVGRTQDLLYVLRELEDVGKIPALEVFVDSPMAIDATGITLDHQEEFDEAARSLIRQGIKPMAPSRLHYVRDANQSRALDTLEGTAIVLSASGMCTGGRIKHHLKVRLPDERHTVCFVGFQAAETKGRALVEGTEQIWLYGEEVPVRAHVERIEGFSAHADQDEILNWLGGFVTAPRRTFVVHGEPEASAALAARIRSELGWKVAIPELGEVVSLPVAGARRTTREPT